MAGHSKWSKVKHIKGPLDQKRGQLLPKLAKEISVAARLGGSASHADLRLRSAVLVARAPNKPKVQSTATVQHVHPTFEIAADVLEGVSG